MNTIKNGKAPKITEKHLPLPPPCSITLPPAFLVGGPQLRNVEALETEAGELYECRSENDTIYP